MEKGRKEGKKKGRKERKRVRPGRRSGLYPWLPGPFARCLWRAGLLQPWGRGRARWGQPTWSASASSRQLWQRSKIPGLLGP